MPGRLPMKARKKQIVAAVDSRIGFYRRSMVGVFILGVASGAGILCGTADAGGTGAARMPELEVLACFAIAVTGIATGSACQRRIRRLREHRGRILVPDEDGEAFAAPAREQGIVEIQALFGILFVLAAAGCYLGCPVPALPGFLDTLPLRAAPAAGFTLLCGITVGLERKRPGTGLHPLQDFVEDQRKRARMRSVGRAGPPPAFQ